MSGQLNDYSQADKREQNSRKALIFIIISILIFFNGLLLWQFFDKKSHLEEVSKTLESTTAERDALSAELQRVKAEFEKVNQENSSLQSLLLSKDEEIKSKMAQIRRMIESGDAAQLKTAREELERLKSMNQVYVQDLDSLKSYNNTLASQNETLSTSLNQERDRINSLTQENSLLSNKVAVASVLKTTAFKATGIKYKSSGREIETMKASSVQKIKTCFTVLENTVANSGNKDIYMRVMSPDGVVMTASSETFMVNGQASLYTTKESFEYDNKEMNLCVYWEKGSAYSTGKYTIEVYCEGSLIASSSIDLK